MLPEHWGHPHRSATAVGSPPKNLPWLSLHGQREKALGSPVKPASKKKTIPKGKDHQAAGLCLGPHLPYSPGEVLAKAPWPQQPCASPRQRMGRAHWALHQLGKTQPPLHSLGRGFCAFQHKKHHK